MKKTGLEKFIIKNRDEFNIEEPGDGHFERFAEKQQAHGRLRRPGFNPVFLVKAAAVTLLVILSSVWLYERLPAGSDLLNRGNVTLADMGQEYRDAEIYYLSLINQKYREIGSFEFGNAHERELILNELAEMDHIYRALEKELNTERGNQMIVNAMIRHYQLKVDIMGRILDQLHQVRSATLDGYDSESAMSLLSVKNNEA
jgi:hypothetical protein